MKKLKVKVLILKISQFFNFFVVLIDFIMDFHFTSLNFWFWDQKETEITMKIYILLIYMIIGDSNNQNYPSLYIFIKDKGFLIITNNLKIAWARHTVKREFSPAKVNDPSISVLLYFQTILIPCYFSQSLIIIG